MPLSNTMRKYALAGGMTFASALILWLARAHSRDIQTHEIPYVGESDTPNVRMDRSREHLNTSARPGNAERVGLVPSSVPLKLSSVARLAPEDARLLWNTEQREIARCMQARGFEYIPVDYDADHSDRVKETKLDPSDIDAARALGFGIADAIENAADPPPDPNAARMRDMEPSLQRAYQNALSGPAIPSGTTTPNPDVAAVSIPNGPVVRWNKSACLGRARAQIHGEDISYRQREIELGMLSGKIDKAIEQDRTYATAVTNWRKCMVGRDQTYEHPGAARIELTRRYHQGELTLDQLRQRETNIAVHEAECHRAAGLADALATAEERAESAVSEQHQDLLRSVAEDQSAAIERAEYLLGR